MKKTIEELGALLTAHADDLQIYSNGLEEDAVLALEQTEDSIMEVVYQLYEAYGESGLPMDMSTQKKIEEIKERIADIRNSVYEEELEEIQTEARAVVKNEGKFLYAFFGLLQTDISSDKQVKRLTAAWYDKISKYGVYNGNTIKGLLNDLQDSEARRVRDAIVRGLFGRKDLTELRKMVKQELEKSRRYMRKTVNAVVNGAKNDAAEAFAKENESYILYSAVLDMYTCETCSDDDGKIYPSDSKDLPFLPRHFGCRCNYIPIPADDERLKNLRVSFKDYLETLSETEQKERLGAEKYRLWKDGKYQLKDWESPVTAMSMDELKKRDQERVKS